MATKPQVGVYLRQSKYHDASVSMDLQEEQCRRLAEREGWTVAGLWRDDDTSGRATGNRPGLRDLRAAYERGEFSRVIAHSVSRLSRNMADGVEIVGAMPLATVLGGVQDADDDFVPLLHMLLGHKQSNEIRKRWREILEHRAELGLPPSGGDRYGYTYTPSAVTGADGKKVRTAPEDAYKINEDQAQHVRSMYSWYIGGAGFATIVTRLNGSGVRTVRGSLWTTTRLLEYMDAGFPAGYFRFGKGLVRGIWEPIISEETWQAYRRRRNANKKTSARTKGSGWELQGIARCERCGGPLSRSGNDGQRYVRCSRNASSGAAVCKGVSYLEVSVTEQTAEFLEQRLQEWAGELPDDSGERERIRTAIDAIDAQIADVAEEQARLIDLYASGELDSDGYQISKARRAQKRDELEAQKGALEDELAELGPEFGEHPLTIEFREWDTSGNPEAEAWQEKQREALTELQRSRVLWEEIRRRMEPMSPEERRALYGRMLKGIYVGESTVRFVAQDGHEETVPRLAPRKKGVKLSNKAAKGVHGAVRAWAQLKGLEVNKSGAVSEELLTMWEKETGNSRSDVIPSR